MGVSGEELLGRQVGQRDCRAAGGLSACSWVSKEEEKGLS